MWKTVQKKEKRERGGMRKNEGEQESERGVRDQGKKKGWREQERKRDL